jgi:vitamin B12 transporter
MKKDRILAVLLLCSLSRLQGQWLDEVAVWADRLSKLGGNEIRYSDTLDISKVHSPVLGNQLQSITPLWIRTDLPGQYASVSFRGLPGSHTQVQFNGMPLQSPALGLSDLNAIPSFLFDRVQFTTGGNEGALAGTAAGGIVDLSNIQSRDSATFVRLGVGIGSFQQAELWAHTGFRHKAFFSEVRIFTSKAENNFPYTDTRGSEQIREGAAFEQEGLMYLLRYKPSTQNQFEYNFWIQQNDIGIPTNILVSLPQGQQQTDIAVRQFFSWKKASGFQLKSAWFYEASDYMHERNGIADFNASHTAQLMPEWEKAGRKMHWKVGGFFAHSFAWGFSKEGQRNQAAFFVNTRFRPLSNMPISLGLRHDIASDGRPLPSFHTHIQYRFRSTQRFRLSYSLTNRRPSLNDLFWSPGGNPNLNPEQGYMLELAWNAEWRKKHISILPEILVFQQEMKDLIRWLPTNQNFWVPKNTQFMRSHGMEIGVVLKREFSKGYWQFRPAYQYTWSEYIEEDQAFLAPGIPVHRFRATADIHYLKWSMSLQNQITSDWYNVQDAGPLDQLQGLHLYDLQFHYKDRWRRFPYQLSFLVQNVGNQSYAFRPYMPMPGRSFQFKLTVEMSK